MKKLPIQPEIASSKNFRTAPINVFAEKANKDLSGVGNPVSFGRVFKCIDF